jgi:hypothetical protein
LISSPRNLIESEAKPRTGSKCENLKSSPIPVIGDCLCGQSLPVLYVNFV